MRATLILLLLPAIDAAVHAVVLGAQACRAYRPYGRGSGSNIRTHARSQLQLVAAVPGITDALLRAHRRVSASFQTDKGQNAVAKHIDGFILADYWH